MGEASGTVHFIGDPFHDFPNFLFILYVFILWIVYLIGYWRACCEAYYNKVGEWPGSETIFSVFRWGCRSCQEKKG